MVFNPLKSGDLIGVLATSSPAKQERFEAGVRALEGQGFKLKVLGDPYGAYGTDRYLFASAPAAERAANLAQLYRDPAVKAVISARGAGGAIELLPLLASNAFKGNPKPFIGFSDSTALLIGLQKHGCPVIHGPHVESFMAAESDPEVLQSLRILTELLSASTGIVSGPLKPLLNSASCRGALIGGNLSVLAALCGTPWQPSAAGKILFLEEINEKPYRVHRMLVQLRQSGVLEGVVGVCLGSFTKCEGEVGPSLETVLKDALAPLAVPVYTGLSAGHIKANRAIPFFGSAEIIDHQLTVYLN